MHYYFKLSTCNLMRCQFTQSLTQYTTELPPFTSRPIHTHAHHLLLLDLASLLQSALHCLEHTLDGATDTLQQHRPAHHHHHTSTPALLTMLKRTLTKSSALSCPRGEEREAMELSSPACVHAHEGPAEDNKASTAASKPAVPENTLY